MVQIETERLVLRGWKTEDLCDFYDYAKNPNIGPRAGWPPHHDKDESLRILQSFILNEEVWAIVDKETSKVIGSIGLHKDHKRDVKKAKMIGFVIAENHWGKGYTVEATKAILRYAFEEMKVPIISVYHYPFNHQSKRVIEKCGFIYEGCLRMASTLYDGTIYDDMCYSMTSDDYFRLKENEDRKY